MTAARLILLAFALSIGAARAEVSPSPDAVSGAYDAALADLRAGKDRQGIVDRLKPVVVKHPKSAWAFLARPFLHDLAATAGNRPARPEELPEKRLADTRVPFHVLRYGSNWDRSLKAFVEQEPEDPVAHLVSANRSVITRLVPLLNNRTPARCDERVLTSFDWSRPQPRVCDLALALVEYHGRVRFHRDTISGTYLHQLPESEHKNVTERVAGWWEEVRDKSVIAGVRAQLPCARSYPETIEMATTLARLAGEQKTNDREFALDALRRMVRQNPRNHVGTAAADALAEFGDTSSVDIFAEEWRSSLGQRPIRDPHVAFYLMKHGGRREWELLHSMVVNELRVGKTPDEQSAWGSIVANAANERHPFAIPILGLGLQQAGDPNHRHVAEAACEALQVQVGRDFGYLRNAPEKERFAALRKAKAWWNADGKARYSFDYIEKKIRRRRPSPAKLEQKLGYSSGRGLGRLMTSGSQRPFCTQACTSTPSRRVWKPVM